MFFLSLLICFYINFSNDTTLLLTLSAWLRGNVIFSEVNKVKRQKFLEDITVSNDHLYCKSLCRSVCLFIHGGWEGMGGCRFFSLSFSLLENIKSGV